jgi:hypothetical protein
MRCQMSDIILNVSISLDEDKFLRRECPHCLQEFKIQISTEDLKNIAEKGIESFLTENDESHVEESDGEEDPDDLFCPYCGQAAPATHWWTKEQLAYVKVYAKNIMAKIVNDKFIKPMNSSFNKSSGPISISFKGKEMEYDEPWISDEVNDMVIFELPCCKNKLKINENWVNAVFCFYCGFKHNRKDLEKTFQK